MKIAIIANKAKCPEIDLNRVRIRLQHDHDIVGISFKENAIKAAECDFCSEQPDLAIVLGGDGTIISACRSFHTKQVPILGVNFGKLGYLANFRYEDFIAQPMATLEWAFKRVSQRMLLRVAIGGRGNSVIPPIMAVNDLVIDIGAPFRTTEVQVAVDNHELSNIRGDGIIVATPTGSTAYNLSAGGPILHPETESIVLTPKNPHRLSFRPVVTRASSDIVLKVPNPEGVFAIVDGQEVFPLADYDGYVTIDRYPADLQLIEQTDYWETLREKLHWGC